MERKPYYITVQVGMQNAEIRNSKGESSYDFEVHATEDEAALLKDLMEEAYHSDTIGYFHSHFFANVIDTADRDHMIYDRLLNEIYLTIYDLGTDQTKKDIEEMGILERLKEVKPSHNPTDPNLLQ
ncbi:hypothetical protein [Pseudalkalibacillus salsuginis]|uniref:hypothetical protein n=1 Tax=Pseudalkalibacillus salsuginis TaxID=2910972 RepID=UPI001F324EA6|nr:hypothetical protein [Pseudalkalibacillus salsuginis]MCF6409302.1 hypothetical protein [Pseudalkalibacillus salsuginis]